MLGFLRRQKNHPLIATFLVAIILVFIFFFGQQWSTCDQASWAAKVNGETISEREFARQYSSRFRQYQQQFQQFDRAMAERMDLRRKILDSIVFSRILASEAEARGLAVDDEALRAELLARPEFQVGGRFDKDRYERIVQAEGLTMGDFEESLRQDLLIRGLVGVVEGAPYLSRAELKQIQEAKSTQFNLRFVKVLFESFVRLTEAPEDAAAETWLKGTSDATERVTKYYQKHAATTYNVPLKIRARHILARTEPEMPPDLKEKAYNRIVEARRAIVDNKLTFEEAAKKYSDDINRDKGGDLGFFARGQMVGPFEETAFGLKPGELSNIVETRFGYELIRVDDIQQPIERKLEDVKVEIAKALIREEKAQELAEVRARSIVEARKRGEDWSAIITGKDGDRLTLEETGVFALEREYIPKIGFEREIAKEVWKLKPEKPLPDAPMKTEHAWIVLELIERTTPMEDESKLVTEVMPRLLFEKRNQLLEAWNQTLLKNASVSLNPAMLRYDDAGDTNGKPQ